MPNNAADGRNSDLVLAQTFMPTRYLFIFAQAHDEFRIPEILSIAELYGFKIGFPNVFDGSQPFLILELDEEEHVRILAKRCILIKSVFEFYAQGASYEEMHAQNQANRPLWSKYEHTSFKFIVNGYNRSLSQSYQRKVIESFGYMELLGKIDMKGPEIILGCFEEHKDTRGIPSKDRLEEGRLRQIYFGRLITEGSARQLVKKFDVKKREYYGNTSMEAEVSLLMANQALAAPGKLIYDPFIGTGSMAYTAAHFGAMVFGSDIDGRQMRGKEKMPGILRSAKQYGISDRIVGLCTFDVTQNPWRCGELFDAIVTDPPYGVRAGAKRLGRKHEKIVKQPMHNSENLRPSDLPYIPPTRPYELSELARDLVLLARYLLKPGGRLVFFLPTVTDEYEEVDINSMLCEGMEVISNSLQDFGAWGRRLVTIRKASTLPCLPSDFTRHDSVRDDDHIPAHHDFRGRYFQGFRRRDDPPPDADNP